jgi:alpha-tubulin suppressor-like RCC1 family protein
MLRLWTLVPMLVATACLPDLLDPADHARQVMVPDSLQLTVGTTVVLDVVVRDNGGVPIPDAEVAYFPQDAAIASVNADGEVTAHAPGRTTITVTSGGASDSVAVHVGLRFDQLAAGRDHTCGLTLGGLYCWGRNDRGQLGVGDRSDRLVPVRVPGTWTMVATGAEHTCALDPGGQASCWGRGSDGRIGQSSTADALSPVPVTGGHAFDHLALGDAYACGRQGLSIRCWGANGSGQLGDGSQVGRNTPVAVVTDTSFTSVFVGGSHTCALDLRGTTWCWGANDRGQLGVDTMVTLPQTTPRRTLDSLRFNALALGQAFSCGRTFTSAVFCWGRGEEHQLGLGVLVTAQYAPAALTTVAGDTLRFRNLAAGWVHACGVLATDMLACWGTSRLGLPNLHQAARPTEVGVAGDLLALGRTHTCHRAAQTVSCWGGGSDGALGFGDLTSTDLPRPVALQLPVSGG